MDPVRAYDYLTQARAKLFGWLHPLSLEQYVQEFLFGHHTLRKTMLEIAGGEWLYGRRLSGEAVPPREAWPTTEERLPTVSALESWWREQAPDTRARLAAVDDWGRPVEYRVVRGDKTIVVTTTAGDIATQMCFHEVHHRAQAMAMLRHLGVAAENLDYSLFIFKRREEPVVR